MTKIQFYQNALFKIYKNQVLHGYTKSYNDLKVQAFQSRKKIHLKKVKKLQFCQNALFRIYKNQVLHGFTKSYRNLKIQAF